MNFGLFGAAADETQCPHRVLRFGCQQEGPKGTGYALHLLWCGDQVDRRL